MEGNRLVLFQIVRMATFDLRKSVNDNASVYFEKSKKLKNKIEGIERTVSKYVKEKEKLELKEKESAEKTEEVHKLKHRKKEWFEKFRWFHTSKGNLCIGGRDASSNESIIKKYVEKDDLIFHTDMAGSPFFVLKLSGKSTVSNDELEEVATATASYSKAWGKGLSESDVFYVKPEQVTKEANSGESLSTGSFVIRGETNYVRNKMQLAVGVEDNGRVNCGSVKSISSRFKEYAVLVQGDEKASDVAKKLKRFFKNGLLDDLVKIVPSGGAKLVEVVR